jgi:hypothetical protein
MVLSTTLIHSYDSWKDEKARGRARGHTEKMKKRERVNSESAHLLFVRRVLLFVYERVKRLLAQTK